ncbi:MAG: nucleotidyltransferase substrate binding protein [Flavobacteriales bacterium]
MSEKDIRWMQRFSNYNKALAKLDLAVERIIKEYGVEEADGWLAFKPELDDAVLDDLLKVSLIKHFEFTYELAWLVLKDFLQHAGGFQITGSIDAIRAAFKEGLITKGEVWMSMVESRNKTSHTYNEEVADEIFVKILVSFHPAFHQMQQKLESIRSGAQGNLFDQR